MDEATKAVIAGWIRHLISFAAGVWGLEAWVNPDLMNGLVAVALTAIAFAWSYIAKKAKPPVTNEQQYVP